MSENTWDLEACMISDWPKPITVRFEEDPPPAAVPVQVFQFNGCGGRALPFGKLRRERLIDDSVRACVDFSKVRLDEFGFLAVQGLDVEAIGAEFARRAAL